MILTIRTFCKKSFLLIKAQLKILFADYRHIANFDLDQELTFLMTELDPKLFDSELLQLGDYLSVLIPSGDLVGLKLKYEDSKAKVLSILKDMHNELEMLLLAIADYEEPWKQSNDASLLFALLYLREAMISAENPQSHYSVKLRADFTTIFMTMCDEEMFSKGLLKHLAAMQVYYYFFELLDSRFRYYETLKPGSIYQFKSLPKESWPEMSKFTCQIKRGTSPFWSGIHLNEQLEMLKLTLEDFKSITQYPALVAHFHPYIQLSEYLQLTFRKVTDKTLPYLLLGLFLSDLKNMFSRPELSDEYSSSISDSTLAVYRPVFVEYFGEDFQKLCIDVTHRLQERLIDYVTATMLLKSYTDECIYLLPITEKDLSFLALVKVYDPREIEGGEAFIFLLYFTRKFKDC